MALRQNPDLLPSIRLASVNGTYQRRSAKILQRLGLDTALARCPLQALEARTTQQLLDQQANVLCIHPALRVRPHWLVRCLLVELLMSDVIRVTDLNEEMRGEW
jgi:hypothetical protein